MALTSSITKALPLPHEPGQEITIRMPSWLHLKEARDIRIAAALKRAHELADLIPAFQAAAATTVAAATEPDAGAALRAFRADYDAETLLRVAVVGWSYPEPVTPENVGDLDEQTKEFLLDELFGFFHRGDDDRLNGSSPSTSPSTGRKATARRTSGS